jgi:hypothetical protein
MRGKDGNHLDTETEETITRGDTDWQLKLRDAPLTGQESVRFRLVSILLPDHMRQKAILKSMLEREYPPIDKSRSASVTAQFRWQWR